MIYGSKCNVHFRGILCVALRLLSRLMVRAVYDLPNLWRSWNAKSTSCQTASLCLTVCALIISYRESSCVHLRGMDDGHDQFRCEINCFSSWSKQPTYFCHKCDKYPVDQAQGHHTVVLYSRTTHRRVIYSPLAFKNVGCWKAIFCWNFSLNTLV